MVRRNPTILWLLGLLLGGTLATAQVSSQQHPPENTSAYIQAMLDPSRDAWQQPEEVMAKLAIKPGESIADLGSGPGYFTIRFARVVGPKGKVYAIDILPEMLDYVAKQSRAEGLGNILSILAGPHDPKLPAASVDLIFICDTLHHISQRPEYYPLLLRALKPGGRLVNIDFEKRPLPVGPPVEMKIAKTDMIKEAESAGFRLADQFDFLKYQYFLVFGRE
jgi:arsenite methyltransferase